MLKRRHLEAVAREREARVKEIRVRYAARRLEVLRDGMLGKRIKRDLYPSSGTAACGVEMQADMARKARRDSCRAIWWLTTWLMARAARGDETALAVLRTAPSSRGWQWILRGPAATPRYRRAARRSSTAPPVHANGM
jgi:hypothetical protein